MYVPFTDKNRAVIPMMERAQQRQRGLAGFGLGAYSAGEALVSMKLQQIQADAAALTNVVGMGSSASMQAIVQRLDAIRDEVGKYIGEPKASAINAKLADAVKKQKAYAAAGEITNFQNRIKGKITEIQGMLQTPMPIVSPPPMTPAAVELPAGPGVPLSTVGVPIGKWVLYGAVVAVVGLAVTTLLKKRS